MTGYIRSFVTLLVLHLRKFSAPAVSMMSQITLAIKTTYIYNNKQFIYSQVTFKKTVNIES